MAAPLSQYLLPTFFINSDHGDVITFAETICQECTTVKEKAVALYYAVRDTIRYDPFDLEYSRTAMQASTVLQKKSGYCVSKAVLLAAVGRQQGIPCRLGFADVTNHLTSPRLQALMGTNLFIYHGYTEMHLDDKWVKATPAFNISLCNRFKVKPLEFDGAEDSIFHEFDSEGQKHMEYVRDHGSFDDLPFEMIFAAYGKTYPNFFETFGSGTTIDLDNDAEQESRLE